MKQGEFAFGQYERLVVTAWQDKTVTMAAKMCQLNANTMVKRRQKDGPSTMVPFP